MIYDYETYCLIETVNNYGDEELLVENKEEEEEHEKEYKAGDKIPEKELLRRSTDFRKGTHKNETTKKANDSFKKGDLKDKPEDDDKKKSDDDEDEEVDDKKKITKKDVKKQVKKLMHSNPSKKDIKKRLKSKKPSMLSKIAPKAWAGKMNEQQRESFKKLLKTHIVFFEYIKRDGSLRMARGTLIPSYLPKVKGTGIPKPEHQMVYYDLMRKDWRSFRSFKFIKVKKIK